MDRESEYFEKELSRNKLDKSVYGLYQVLKKQINQPDLPIRHLLAVSHRETEHRYMNVKPRRLANYLAVRRLLIEGSSKFALKVIKDADNQMLGEAQ